ncbi:MAG: GNAT family N-acetyltransferase [Arenicellales bacterium]
MPDQHPIQIRQATAGDLPLVRALFREYEASIDAQYCFQSFEVELADLPGYYAAPGGCLLIARSGETAAGCVALRRLDDKSGEVKRFFVREHYQGAGLGAELMTRLIANAQNAGFESLVLETLPTMRSANGLYERLGFVRRSAYHRDSAPGITHLSLSLKRAPLE